MRLSQAPNNYPSGTRPVAAAGAGVQFATDPIHGMRTRDSLPTLTMQNGTGTGSVAFNFQGIAGRGEAGRGWARQGAAWHGNNASLARYPSAIFRGPSGRCKPGNGIARRGSARHGYTLPRAESGTIFRGAAVLGVSSPGAPWRVNNVTGDGNPGHFPKHQEAPASRGATVDGMTGNV